MKDLYEQGVFLKSIHNGKEPPPPLLTGNDQAWMKGLLEHNGQEDI